MMRHEGAKSEARGAERGGFFGGKCSPHQLGGSGREAPTVGSRAKPGELAI